MSVVTLAIKPSLAEEIKKDVVDILERVLEIAKKGEAISCIVIIRRPNGTWSDERSGAMDFPDAIGRLEIIKQSWIASYLAGCDDN